MTYNGFPTQATYHGITSAQCMACGYATEDPHTLEVWNDQTGKCPMCGHHVAEWRESDGTSRVVCDHPGLGPHEIPAGTECAARLTTHAQPE